MTIGIFVSNILKLLLLWSQLKLEHHEASYHDANGYRLWAD